MKYAYFMLKIEQSTLDFILRAHNCEKKTHNFAVKVNISWCMKFILKRTNSLRIFVKKNTRH